MQKLKSGSANARKSAAKELWREPNPRAVDVLSKAASSDPDADVRAIAASALGRLQGPERIPPLLRTLNDKDPDVVRSALLGLRRINDATVVREFVRLLKHQEFIVRTSAAQAIDTIRWAPSDLQERIWFAVAKGWYDRSASSGVEALPALKLTVETAPISSAIRAIEALGKITDPSVLKLLCDSLKSPEPAICIAAVEGLGKVGGSEAVTSLIGCLQNNHPQVRAESARALGILGAVEATPLISKLLEDKEWEVRKEAAGALGKLKNPEAFEPLTKVLNDMDADVREAAASALSKMRDRRAVGPLVMALKDEVGGVRRIAAAGLAKIDPDWVSLPETRVAAEKLKVAIQDADPAVRFFVAQLLINLGEMSPDALLGFNPEEQLTPANKRPRIASNLFIALLEDRDRDIRQAAAEALGQLGGERARQALIRAGGDPDGDVEAAMQMALQALGPETPH
jgi:HEAT repeat protein